MKTLMWIRESVNNVIDTLDYIWKTIIDYLIWVYHDGISWSLIERYQIDEINKKIMVNIWYLLISSIGLIVFSIELIFIPKYQNPQIVFAIPMVILIYVIIGLSAALDLMIKNANLYVMSCQAIFQYPEQMSNREHSAIIIIHYENPLTDEGVADIAALLIEGFRKNCIPYKVYHCFNSDDFEPIFYNNLVTDLWIIAHGDHGGFSFGKKRRKIDYFSYSSLKKMPPKKFIAQLHCNCRNGESLVSINKPVEGFVTDRIQTLTQIRHYIIKKIQVLDR